MCTTGCLVVRKVSTEATSSDDDGSNNDANSSVTVDGDVTETEDDPELAYMSTKAMGNADREVSYTSLNFVDFPNMPACQLLTHLPKSGRTTDIRTIFIKTDDHINPHTGLVESGHVCKVCR